MRPMRILRVVWIPAFLLFAINAAPAAATAQDGKALVLVGARIYPAPGSPPINDGMVVSANGKIVFVGKQDQKKIPAGATVIDCHGMFVTAGFQNSHAHFTEPKWMGTAMLPADRLTQQLQTMLTRYGITTVVDTGSVPDNTFALRA